MNHAEPYNPVLERPTDLLVPVAVSVVLHALFVWLFTVSGSAGVTLSSSTPLDVELLKPEEARRRAHPQPPPPADVEPTVQNSAQPPPPARPKNQIVAPPEGPEAIPENPRFLSDRNSRADQESIKRGEPAPPAEPPRETARDSRPSPDESKAARSGAPGQPGSTRARDAAPAPALPGLETLFARPSELLGDPSIVNGKRGDGADIDRRIAAAPRPLLWADPGERGTPDYLPDVRQGRFTLLNTKADLFAPFVRRVGLRVFQTFSMDFKRRIFSGSVPQGQETLEIEAVMSRDGRRLEVVLRKRNGNLAADRVLLGTLTDHIFFDENPPPNAVADDGHIHFLFALDASVWYGRDEQTGGPRPGAQWVFGAGLL